jgi:hypothetical protein
MRAVGYKVIGPHMLRPETDNDWRLCYVPAMILRPEQFVILWEKDDAEITPYRSGCGRS